MNNNNLFRIIRLSAFLSLWLGLLLPAFSQSAVFPSRPVPPRLVNDFCKILKPQQAQQLEKMLVAYNDSTSTQIAVVIVNTLHGYDITDYTDRLAEKWGVGRKEKNNGVVILIKPKLTAFDYGEVRISVGYGLEDVIPDAIAKRIVNQEMIPRFQENDYYGGVVAAVGVIMDLASGKYTADQYGDDFDIVAVIVVVSIFIILFILPLIFSKKSKSNPNGKLPLIFLGGGGGFRGSGGGRGGGFGGFGGGGFGGGGASGRW